MLVEEQMKVPITNNLYKYIKINQNATKNIIDNVALTQPIHSLNMKILLNLNVLLL